MYCRRLPFLLLFLSVCANASSDLPPTGYSLFDRLFSKPVASGHEYDIPYPFEKLLRELERRLAAAEAENESPLVTSLIPRGRSLQREAASPDHFRFPRIVVALDQDSRLPLATRNRLFLGYQEKANSIEIISYNEQAGRFEFQVVEDYGAGLRPRVRYASRDLCTSCHQNEAPIFARPRWRESNFNNEVARLIAEHQQDYHGIAAEADKGDAARFDFATDQAGLFSAYQRVWQDGCDVSREQSQNRGCRAGLFFAAIQQAIASIPRSRYRSALIEQRMLPLLRDNWQRRWPQGMPVAGADIDDRESPGPEQTSRVTSQQDPLSRRPVLANWSYKPALRRSIQGIGEQFLLLGDLVRLNATLSRKAATGDLPRQSIDGYCRLQFMPAEAEGRWVNVDCRFQQKKESGISIEGELWQASYDEQSSGRGKLLVTGTEGWARVEVNSSLQQANPQTLHFHLGGTAQNSTARLWDNRILSRIKVDLPSSTWDATTRLPAQIELSDDFSLVEDAIYQMLDDAENGELSVFDKAPLPGAELMRALQQKLDVASADYPAMGLPTGLRRESVGADYSGATMLDALPAESPLRLVFKHCAACHSSPVQMPPGFLHGDIGRIESQLRQCAPRIALRLAMWRQHADERIKSPMPPPTAFAGEAKTWPDSSDFRELSIYVKQLLTTAGATLPDAEDYDLLPRCLAASS